MNDNTTLQYLTFALGEEIFALETGSVREVIELVPVTRIPKTPPFMRGVINPVSYTHLTLPTKRIV